LTEFTPERIAELKAMLERGEAMGGWLRFSDMEREMLTEIERLQERLKAAEKLADAVKAMELEREFDDVEVPEADWHGSIRATLSALAAFREARRSGRLASAEEIADPEVDSQK